MVLANFPVFKNPGLTEFCYDRVMKLKALVVIQYALMESDQ